MRKSKLKISIQYKLLDYFVAGVSARASAEMFGIQINTATHFFIRLRKLIASKLPSYELDGEVEVDESYFGGVRKGKRKAEVHQVK